MLTTHRALPMRSEPPVSAYASAILATPGLVSYWRLNYVFTAADGKFGPGSPTATDSRSGDNAGYSTSLLTPNQGPLITSDSLANSVTLSNATWAQATISTPLTNALTIEAWIKPTSLINSGTYVIGSLQNAFSSGSSGLYLLQATAKKISMKIAATSSTSASTVFTAGNIYHVVGTYDGTAIRTYVNGTLTSGPTNVTVSNATTKLVAIGANISTNGTLWQQQIGEVAVYSSALSSGTIANHHTLGTT